MIKDIQRVSDSYYFTKNDITVYEKLNMFYFKVIINQSSCTILSHNHKILTDADIIINSMWKDVFDFVNKNILPKQQIISNLYDSVIIGFLYCPNEQPLNINYSKFFNILNDNNKFIINSVKKTNKENISIKDFCLSINLLNIRGIGGGPIISINDNFINALNDYAHKKISLFEFKNTIKNNIKTYSLNDLDDIEGLIIKTNKNLYQIIFNATNDTKVYNRNDFEILITDFVNIWNEKNIKIDHLYSYKDIISEIFLKYINMSNIHKKITTSENLIPPGNHYIGDISYELLDTNVATICKLNNIYKNIFRILFNGLKHYKKPSKYNKLNDKIINSWNNIVNQINEQLKRKNN